MTAPLDDEAVSRLALDKGYVNQLQLEECLEIQEMLSPSRPLWVILMEKGYLSPSQIDEWVAEAIPDLEFFNLPKTISTDELLGKIMIEKGFITQNQLEECAIIQKLQPPPYPLGLVLIEKGYLSPSELINIASSVPSFYEKLQNLKREASSLPPDTHKKRLSEEKLKKAMLEQLFVTEEQLEECIKEQNELSRRGIPIDLAGVLTHKGYLTLNQLERIENSLTS